MPAAALPKRYGGATLLSTGFCGDTAKPQQFQRALALKDYPEHVGDVVAKAYLRVSRWYMRHRLDRLLIYAEVEFAERLHFAVRRSPATALLLGGRRGR